MHNSKSKRCYNVKHSAYYFCVTKIFIHFQISIIVPLVYYCTLVYFIVPLVYYISVLFSSEPLMFINYQRPFDKLSFTSVSARFQINLTISKPLLLIVLGMKIFIHVKKDQEGNTLSSILNRCMEA